MKPLDLFISHSSADVEVARQLKALLDEAGYASFIAPDDVIGTDTWTEQILGAIERSRAMIVLVSERANRSTHVSREVNLALGRKRPVLPIRIEPVGPEGSLEYLLSLVQRIDAFPPPISAHAKPILHRVEAILRTADDAEAASPEPPGVPSPATPPPSPVPQPSPTPAGGLAVGARIAGFTIVERIGEGGQATIYRATQAEPKRDVALKVIRMDHAADAAYRARFLAEKDTLAQLEHPGIVPIYAAGEADGVLFIAMRLIDAPDLGARLRTTGTLSAAQTATILQPVADALDYAHKRGIIHRDVKPSNILIDSGGRPYLSDFGLGKQASGGPEISEPGMAVGTLEYMAPEQFATGDQASLTPAADIYALGCVAYACLSGHPPFRGDTPEQVLAAQASPAPPSLSTSRPDLPLAIDDVLARALAKSPAERYSTASGLVQALAVAGASEQTRPIPVPPPATPVGRAQTWVRANTPAAAIGGVLGVLVLVLAGSAVFGGGRSGPTASPGGGAGVPSRSPIVTRTPTVTPTPVVSTPPSPTAPPAYPNAAELRLIAALPQGSGIQDGCERFDARYPGSTAGIACDDPSGGTAKLFYQSWPDKPAMDAMYRSVLGAATVKPGGLCKDAPPADADWVLETDGDVQGRLACFAEARTPGRVSYLWTHDDTLVMSFWSAPSNAAGFEFWKKWVVAPR